MANDAWHRFFDAYAANWRALTVDDGWETWQRWVDHQDIFVMEAALTQLGREWDYKRAGRPTLPQVQAAYYRERDRRMGRTALVVDPATLRPCDHCQDSGYVFAIRDNGTMKFIDVKKGAFACGSLVVWPVFCDCDRGLMHCGDKASDDDRRNISEKSFGGGLKGRMSAAAFVRECQRLADESRVQRPESNVQRPMSRVQGESRVQSPGRFGDDAAR